MCNTQPAGAFMDDPVVAVVGRQLWLRGRVAVRTGRRRGWRRPQPWCSSSGVRYFRPWWSLPCIERSDAVKLAVELTGVFDLFQVWVFGLDVPEQALDPGLVVGGAGPSEVLGDAHSGHEGLDGGGGHLRGRCRPGPAARAVRLVGHDAGADLVEQAVFE